MAQFSWTDDLHTGSSLIDNDYRELIGLVNIPFDAMDGGPNSKRIGAAMTQLIAYTGAHFAREEAEMERIQFVASFAHHAEHAKPLQQLLELNAIVDAGGRINLPAVSDFLGEWLRGHILATDL